MSEPQNDKKQGGSTIKSVLILFMLILFSIVMLPFMLVAAVGMLPALVVWFIDNRAEKNVAMTIAMMNFCGIIPNLISLWNKGGDLPHALYIVRDPFSLMVMYGAAGLGWLLINVMPPIMAFLISMRTEETLRQLEDRMKKLRDEWGDSLKNAAIEISPEEVQNYDL